MSDYFFAEYGFYTLLLFDVVYSVSSSVSSLSITKTWMVGTHAQRNGIESRLAPPVAICLHPHSRDKVGHLP